VSSYNLGRTNPPSPIFFPKQQKSNFFRRKTRRDGDGGCRYERVRALHFWSLKNLEKIMKTSRRNDRFFPTKIGGESEVQNRPFGCFARDSLGVRQNRRRRRRRRTGRRGGEGGGRRFGGREKVMNEKRPMDTPLPPTPLPSLSLSLLSFSLVFVSFSALFRSCEFQQGNHLRRRRRDGDGCKDLFMNRRARVRSCACVRVRACVCVCVCIGL
jgi:hypothetical protein